MTTTTTPDGRLILHVEEPFQYVAKGDSESRYETTIRAGDYLLRLICGLRYGVELRTSRDPVPRYTLPLDQLPIPIFCAVLWHFRPHTYKPIYGGTR